MGPVVRIWKFVGIQFPREGILFMPRFERATPSAFPETHFECMAV